MSAGRRVLVIGLDSAEPSLVFDRWRSDLPHLGRLIAGGLHGPLESSTPCVTIPAWACMTTGRDPGELGVYDFFTRMAPVYGRPELVSSLAIQEPQLWDILSAAGKQVVVVGVPPSYPVRPVNGTMVGCFMTPGPDTAFTYPREVAGEIQALVGSYRFDVSTYLTEDKARLLRELYSVTDQHFAVVRHLLVTRPWEFFMFVEVGLDRLHHGFWSCDDPLHPRFVPGHPFASAVRDYYRYLDARIGEVLEVLDDSDVIIVVSDHGAQRMDGGILLNEWLIREGTLVLKRYPSTPTPLYDCEVDWRRTLAWAVGGYHARVFLNVEGREPQGIVPANRVGGLLEDLSARIAAIPGPAGRPLQTKIFRPQVCYRTVKNFPPDLIIYFDDLAWRCIGAVGSGMLHSQHTLMAPDEANHAQHGLFILYDPKAARPGGRVDGLTLLDVGPLVLGLLGVPVPSWMRDAARSVPRGGTGTVG